MMNGTESLAKWTVRNCCALVGVSSRDIDKVWPECRAVFLELFNHPESVLSEKFVLQCLNERLMQLWLVVNEEKNILAAAITQKVDRETPPVSVCVILLIGGKDSERWLDFEDVLCSWAKAEGCSMMEGYDHRKGAWMKHLKNRGWTESYVVVRKQL